MKETRAPDTQGIDQILEEHKELHATIRDIHAFLEQPRPKPGETGAQTWASNLTVQLVAFHDRLFRHFRTEEEECATVGLAKKRSWAWNECQGLMSEHETLLKELKAVIDAAVGYSTATEAEDRQLRRRVTGILGDLDSHERRETDLLQRLYYNDLGLGD